MVAMLQMKLLVVLWNSFGLCWMCPPIRHIDPSQMQIESPNFGPQKSYPPNSRCQWDITIPSRAVGKFSFFEFDLEYIPGCIWDGIEIVEGPCSGKGTSRVRHCGVTSPLPQTLEGSVCLKFWSDSLGQKRGFQLKIFIIPSDTGAGAVVAQNDIEPIPKRQSLLNSGTAEDIGVSGNKGIYIGGEIPSLGTKSNSRPLLAAESNTNNATDDYSSLTHNTYQSTSPTFGTSGVKVVTTSVETPPLAAENQQKSAECGVKTAWNTRFKYRVFGGSIVDSGDVPWQVSVRRDGNHVCGGAILNSLWIMTAAHCVDMIQLSPFRVTILAGSALVYGGSKFAQIARTSEIILYPSYRYGKSGDLALIRLLHPIKFTEFVVPICLPESHALTDFQNCYIAGWGATEKLDGEYKVPSSSLHRANVNISSEEDCKEAYPNRITQYMFCAGNKQGTVDSCKGDSGGSLVCRVTPGAPWQSVGIISWGGQCGQMGQPGVYTHLRHYTTWINDTITPEVPSINCSFTGTAMCGYQDNSRGSLSWRRHDARFPSQGFSSIRLSQGYYLHVDGPIGHSSSPAILLFPERNISSSGCLTFSYAMSHTRVVNLYLEADVHGVERTLWSVIGRFQQDWRNTSVSIPANIDKLRLSFRTDQFSRDVAAIDNINFIAGPCRESELNCDFNLGNTCGFSLLGNKWKIRNNNPSGEMSDFVIALNGSSASSDWPISIQSPVYQNLIPICFQFLVKTTDTEWFIKPSTATQHGGRTYFGETLQELRITANPTWRTFSVDIPSSANSHNFILKFNKGTGRGSLLLDNFRAYDGNCII